MLRFQGEGLKCAKRCMIWSYYMSWEAPVNYFSLLYLVVRHFSVPVLYKPKPRPGSVWTRGMAFSNTHFKLVYAGRITREKVRASS